MLGIVRFAADTAGGQSGTDSGTTVIVLALYGGIFLFALGSWIAWAIRQERGGVIQWGDEAPRETLGQRIARAWRSASAAPAPPEPAPPLPFFDYEAEELPDHRERTAG